MDSVHNQCDEEDWRGHCRRPRGLIWVSKENADVFSREDKGSFKDKVASEQGLNKQVERGLGQVGWKVPGPGTG